MVKPDRNRESLIFGHCGWLAVARSSLPFNPNWWKKTRRQDFGHVPMAQLLELLEMEMRNKDVFLKIFSAGRWWYWGGRDDDCGQWGTTRAKTWIKVLAWLTGFWRCQAKFLGEVKIKLNQTESLCGSLAERKLDARKVPRRRRLKRPMKLPQTVGSNHGNVSHREIHRCHCRCKSGGGCRWKSGQWGSSRSWWHQEGPQTVPFGQKRTACGTIELNGKVNVKNV